MRVRDLMTPELIAVGPTTPVGEVLQLMLRRHLNNVVILDSHRKLLGIVTYSDLSRRLLPSYRELTEHEEYLEVPELLEDRVEEVARLRVDQVMTKDLITVAPDERLLKAGAMMTANHIKQVPVVQEHKLLGILSYTDIGWGMMMEHPESMRNCGSKAHSAG